MRNEFEASGGAEGLGSTSGEKSMRSLESECNPICDSDLVPTGIQKIYLMIFPVDCDVKYLGKILPKTYHRFSPVLPIYQVFPEDCEGNI